MLSCICILIQQFCTPRFLLQLWAKMKGLMYVAFGQRCTGQQDNLCVQDYLDCPLDIKRAGPAREVHVQHNVVVGSPGAKVVLNGSRLGCSRLSHKEAGPARPNSGAEQPC